MMGYDLTDDKGLIFGFAFGADGQVTRIDSESLSQIDSFSGQALWLNLNLNDGRACRWIAECPGSAMMPASHCCPAITAFALRRRETGFRSSLAMPIWMTRPRSAATTSLSISGILITGRRHPLSSLSLLRDEVGAGGAFAGTDQLLIRLLEHMAATFSTLINDFTTRLDDFEDAVFSGHFRDVKGLGRCRQLIARVRRQRHGNQQVLTELIKHLPGGWKKPAVADLRRAVNHLTSLAQDLELAADRGRLLSEEIDSRMNEATNRNLYFVSVAAALFLPITVVSSIFGMNVGGLPWEETPHGFLFSVLCMVVVVLLAFLLMRRRGML
ncbi:MAG: hypothetical protein HC826_00630 [Rhodospirillales bacterium]|nr:hypothetical protein [Rhodospirillales bacterium]